MDSHSDETGHVIFIGKFGKNKKYKENILQEILAAICAMLNSNGGKVVIHFKTDNNDNPVEDLFRSSVIRTLEQSMISINGLQPTVSEINFKEDTESIIVSVKEADSLITTNYNLYLPSQTQVVEVPPLEPLKNIKDNVINRKGVLEPVQLGTHCQIFFKDKKYASVHECKICQLKNLKADPSKRTTLADRMTGKGNKLTCYVSAFANHRGGHIYYGITDGGVVKGELIANKKGKNEIIMKVEKAINKMIWHEQTCQPKRGEHWEIFFEPVVDENSTPVPSTFVIVIYIAPCLGGVFAKEPECYEMVEGGVKKMSFVAWKKRISQPVWLRSKETIPRSDQRITWSSDAARKAFTIHCDELRKIVSNGSWATFPNKCIMLLSKSDLYETMELLILFKQITACIRKGEFQEARELLKDEYMTIFPNVQDSFIFEVLGLYLQAALKRATEDFNGLKEALTAALSKAEQIEPGLVTATIYVFAATVSDLINLKDPTNEIESPVVLTTRALDHLERVPDSSDVLAAMRRKANIILATFHLGCNVSGQLIKDSIETLSLNKAKTCIEAIYKSAYEEHPLSAYFDIQLNLVLSIFRYRHSQLSADQRTQCLRHARSYAKKAKSLATQYQFTEMIQWSENNEALCAQELQRAKGPVQNHVNHADHVGNDEKSNRRDRAEQREGDDCHKSSEEQCDPQNRTEQVGQNDRTEQDNRLEFSKKNSMSREPQKRDDGRPRSPRDVTQKAKPQVMSTKSQNLDDPNIERYSQVKTENEEAPFGAHMVQTSKTVQAPKAQNSSDKQAQPQRDSRTPSGPQKQQCTPPGQSDMSKHVHAKPFQPRSSSTSGNATHQIPPNVSLVTALPETHAYHVNNAVFPMHVTGAPAFEGSVSSSGHTGTSPIVSQELPASCLSFHQFPAAVGPFQVQVPVQQLTPSSYPAGFTYRTPVPHYPAATSVANQPGVLVHKPATMMRQLMLQPIQGPITAYQSQPFPIPQRPTHPQQQQQQQMFGNQQHRLLAEDRTTEHQRQERHWRKQETRTGRNQQQSRYRGLQPTNQQRTIKESGNPNKK